MATKKVDTPTPLPFAVPVSIANPHVPTDGTVQFPSRVGSTYRYQVTNNNDSLSIWLEDRQSKNQWQTGSLQLSDIVKPDSVIPLASFQDYVTVPSDFDEARVGANTNDEWELRLTLKIRVFTKVWSPTYVFLLKPVALSQLDIVTAKMRDQEEQIIQLKKEIEELHVQTTPKTPMEPTKPLYLQAISCKQVGFGQKLTWKNTTATSTAQSGIRVESNGAIRFTVSGTFVVYVSAHSQNGKSAVSLDLQVNGTSVVSCVNGDSEGYHQLSPIYRVVEVLPKDELAVVYHGNNYTSPYMAYILIHQLG